MKKLEAVYVFLYFHQGDVEIQRIEHNGSQHIGMYIFAEKHISSRISHVLKRKLINRVVKHGRNFNDMIRHK